MASSELCHGDSTTSYPLKEILSGDAFNGAITTLEDIMRREGLGPYLTHNHKLNLSPPGSSQSSQDDPSRPNRDEHQRLNAAGEQRRIHSSPTILPDSWIHCPADSSPLITCHQAVEGVDTETQSQPDLIWQEGLRKAYGQLLDDHKGELRVCLMSIHATAALVGTDVTDAATVQRKNLPSCSGDGPPSRILVNRVQRTHTAEGSVTSELGPAEGGNSMFLQLQHLLSIDEGLAYRDPVAISTRHVDGITASFQKVTLQSPTNAGMYADSQ